MNTIIFQQWHLLFLLITFVINESQSIRVTVHAPPVPPSQQATNSAPTILEQNYYRNTNGDYKFQYLTSDSQMRYEEGKLNENGLMVVKGQYRYCYDGVLYIVMYTADRNGYNAFNKQYYNSSQCQNT